MEKIVARVKEEMWALIPLTLFFFIAFQVIALSRRLMLHDYGIHVSNVLGATFGAFLVAKVVLLTDMLPFVKRFPDRPLIYKIIWKTFIYFVAALMVQCLERLIPAWWRSGDFGAAKGQLAEEIGTALFWSIQIWLMVLLFMYCTVRELVRVIGKREMREMLFGRGPV